MGILLSDLKIFKNNDLFDSNSYVLKLNEQTYIIIDPVSSESNFDLIEYITGLPINSKLVIFLTHEHFDHFFGIHKLLESFSSRIFLSENILKGLNDSRINLSYYHNMEYKCDILNFEEISFSNGLFFLEEFQLSVLFTPGHSTGSQCIFVKDYLFGGDTIIDPKMTTAKLPGGNKTYLKNTISHLKNTIKINYKVCPGRGEMFNFSDWQIN